MNKQDKVKEVGDLRERFSKVKAVILTDFTGLNVHKVTELRTKLRATKIEYKVVKNTLAKKAAEGTLIEAIKDHFLGPVGVVLSYDDPVAMAKVLADFSKKEEKLRIKIGVFENKIVDLNEIRKIANLPSREVLLSQLLAGIQSPIRGFVGILDGIMRNFIFTVDAIKELKTKGQ